MLVVLYATHVIFVIKRNMYSQFTEGVSANKHIVYAKNSHKTQHACYFATKHTYSSQSAPHIYDRFLLFITAWGLTTIWSTNRARYGSMHGFLFQKALIQSKGKWMSTTKPLCKNQKDINLWVSKGKPVPWVWTGSTQFHTQQVAGSSSHHQPHFHLLQLATCSDQMGNHLVPCWPQLFGHLYDRCVWFREWSLPLAPRILKQMCLGFW